MHVDSGAVNCNVILTCMCVCVCVCVCQVTTVFHVQLVFRGFMTPGTADIPYIVTDCTSRSSESVDTVANCTFR
jgi:hypothetical protein